MCQEASEQINYMRQRGRMKCHCLYLYYAIVNFLLLVFFEDPLFSDSPSQVPGGHQNCKRRFT